MEGQDFKSLFSRFTAFTKKEEEIDTLSKLLEPIVTKGYPIGKLIKNLMIEQQSAVAYDSTILLDEINEAKEISAYLALDKNKSERLGYILQNMSLCVIRYWIEEHNYVPKDEDLFLAVQRDKPDVIRYLVENYKLNVNVRNKDHWTPIHVATSLGHINVVKYLIEECHVNIEETMNGDQTPLICATRSDKFEVIKYLVEECHANIDVVTEWYGTPLHCALINRNQVTIRYFIEKGADINIKGGVNKQAILHIATKFGLNELVELLIEHGAKMNELDGGLHTPLDWAIIGDRSGLALMLIHNGAKIDMKGFGGMMPIHHATQEGLLEVVKYIIEEYHIDVNIREDHGYTPLHIAAMNGRIDIVKYLIEECHADINAKDNKDMKPLDKAIENGKTVIAKYFIEECHVSLQMTHQEAAAHSFGVLKYFVELGINVNEQDANGKTLLHHAAEARNTSGICFLIQTCHANPTIRDNNGKLPVDYTDDRLIIAYLTK